MMATADDAISWARRGFRVFPALPLGKRPAIDNYPAEATTDEDKIRAWWSSGEDYNVALAMGRGVIAFDLDTKHDNEYQNAVDMFNLAGGEWGTQVNVSATGGYHVFYKTDEAYRTVTNLLPYIDVRAEGGYVIAPPSFVIEADKGVAGLYTVHNECEVATLPTGIASILPHVRDRVAKDASHAENEAAAALYKDYLVRLAEPAIEGQGGDVQTYDVACMGVRDYGLTVQTTYQLMLEHYNPRCQPPWDAADLLKKVENADMYAIGATGSRDPATIMDGLSFVAPSVTPQAPPQAAPVILSPQRLLPDDAIPVVEWLVPYVLQRGEVTLVSGPTGAGKSSWMLGLLVFMAAGKTYGPFEIPHSMSSMVFNAEDGPEAMSGRASATCILHNISYPKIQGRILTLHSDTTPIVLAEKHEGKIRIPPQTVEFLNAVMAEQPDTCVFCFDPLVACLRGIEENDNGEMNEVLKLCTLIARMYDVSVLIGHHVKKGFMESRTFDPASTDLARGAGSIGTTARIAVNLLPQMPRDEEIQGKRDDVFQIHGAKASHGPKSKVSWWQRKIITIRNGVNYPAPMYILAKDIASAHWRGWIDALGDYMIDHNLNELRVSDAGVILANMDVDDNRSSKSITNALRDFVFRRGDVNHRYIDAHGINYTLTLNVQDEEGRAITRGQFFTLVPLSSSIPLPPVVLPPPPPLDDDLAALQ